METSRLLEIGPCVRRRRRAKHDTLDIVPGCTFLAAWGEEPLPIADDSYDVVLASHVLEHIPWFRCEQALKEVHRILKPGGVFEVWVPDFGKVIDRYRDGTITEDGWLPHNAEGDPWKAMNGRLIWGARPGQVGRFEHFHKALFDAEGLERQLRTAGFREIAPGRRTRGEGHGWMEIGRRCRK